MPTIRAFVLAAMASALVAACASLPTGPDPLVPRPVPSPVQPAPQPAATPEPALAPDRLARVASPAGVVAWGRAGGEGRELDTVPAGALLLLVRSRVADDGATWWLAYADAITSPVRLGWIAETDADGRPAVEPVNPACPEVSGRVAPAALPGTGLERLLCLGSREVELEGQLTCQAGIAEPMVQGAPWSDANRWCDIDERLAVHGEPATGFVDALGGPTTRYRGRHVVVGHVDDPGAEHCIATSFGVTLGPNPGPGEPAPILWCRQQFVVTEVRPADGP